MSEDWPIVSTPGRVSQATIVGDVAVTGALSNTELRADPVETIPGAKTVVIYETGTLLYVCMAEVGTALNSASWQIRKLDTTSGLAMQWADGNASFDNVATDLGTVAGLSYS